MESPISYASWMVFAVPGSIICVIIAWIWLQIQFLGFRQVITCQEENTPKLNEDIKRLIRDEYKKLGPIRLVSQN